MHHPLTIGQAGTFFPSAQGAPSVRAEIVRVWSETCVNLKCSDGTEPTSVYVFRGAGGQPSGYYFVPDPQPGEVVDASFDPAAASPIPRVTLEQIEGEIVAEHCFTARQGAEQASGSHGPFHSSLGLLTICVLVLRNGFTITGTSACASPELFDAAIGRKIARDDAISKAWPLLGFRLRDKLAGGA